MELCGLDEVDRTPNFAESEQLCRQMENFCKDFGEIERRLKLRLKKFLHCLKFAVNVAQKIFPTPANVQIAAKIFQIFWRRLKVFQNLR